MGGEVAGLVIWDIDGTLIPADLRWLRRAIARTYQLAEADVVFPAKKVHGYTDESIVIDTAVNSGVSSADAEAGIPRFREGMKRIMVEGRDEFARVQPAYRGAVESIAALHRLGFVQTVLTGNLRSAAEIKLNANGLDEHLDLDIGGYGSDARDRFLLPGVVAQRYVAVYGDQLDPMRTVVIGDAPNDIACARHAGFRVAVVAHRASREELAGHEPDVILDSLEPTAVVEAVESLVQAG
jgi:phosphoglycolate phosphatase